MGSRIRLALAGLVAALVAVGIAGQVLPDAPEPGNKPALGLFTSLPIYWRESAEFADVLDGDANSDHWARVRLERDNRLVPLDMLDGAELQKLQRLVMAQPRALAPGENVALDDWVRGGGRLLLFADPFLTEHSRYTIGDRRRPEGMVLLSPILKRWGLQLNLDEDQGESERIVRMGAIAVPVEMAGTLTLVAPGAPSDCSLSGEGLIARCRVGKGAVTVIADAALLDGERDPEAGSTALSALVDEAVGQT